jgi:hypothetical protein
MITNKNEIDLDSLIIRLNQDRQSIFTNTRNFTKYKNVHAIKRRSSFEVLFAVLKATKNLDAVGFQIGIE